MGAINWVEAALGLTLCGFGLYLLAVRKAGAGVRLETGAVKLSVSNTGAFLLMLGVVLLILARISAVAWKDVEIRLNRAETDGRALAQQVAQCRQELADARAQAASLAAAADAGGPQRYAVPDLSGLPYDRAVALIRRHNLDTLGVRWLDLSQAAAALAGRGYREIGPGVMADGADTVRLSPGAVLWQAVPPGTRVPGRSRVWLTAVDRD